MMYYKLTDELNFGEVVRTVEGKGYTYRFGAEEWVRSAIMVRYTWPDDPLYGEYTDISEAEAMALLDAQRERLDSLLPLAVRVAQKAHAGQVDKGGKPYILHPTAVAEALDSTENKIVAYLHDVCEDSDVTFEELELMGFTPRIINSVRILTKRPDMSYDDYLALVRSDSNAWHVKVADIKHNMDISRIPSPTQKDFDRLEKYQRALKFLLG